jgi:dTDP-4-dehydrorhamnose reductase
MINILVTGANGQLAKTIALFKNEAPNYNFVFKTKEELDITNKEAINILFKTLSFDYCINCAAYTNVEQAEKTPEIAYEINGEAVKNLAEVCLDFNTKLVHISTDYVFDGESKNPYSERATPNPLNEYGKSKLQGEKYIQKTLEAYYIIRVSWLYSIFEKNFFNTITNCLKKNKELNITTSQKGTPTSCISLTHFIYWIIFSELEYGIYHFSDDGEATWYEFAVEIAKQFGNHEKTKLIQPSENYPTISRRPDYSVLNNNKRKNEYKISIHWKTAIERTYLLCCKDKY